MDILLQEILVILMMMDIYYISGRNKDLIISGGYNVYPKEIEDVINENENVIESAVFGIPNDDLGEVPIAAIVMYQKDNKFK